MVVKDLVDKFGLELTAGKSGLDREVTDAYCGDLLSEIMSNAPRGCAWMTVQGHQNIVAVAVQREMAAIIITGGQTPDDETIKQADRKGIPILLWPNSSFRLAGHLFGLGIGARAAG